MQLITYLTRHIKDSRRHGSAGVGTQHGTGIVREHKQRGKAEARIVAEGEEYYGSRGGFELSMH